MGKYDSVNTGNSGDKTALPPGQYGDKVTAGLEVVNYIGSKETREPGLVRHSFLVASDNGVVGTAFLTFNLDASWLEDGFLALAFNNDALATEEQIKKAKSDLALKAIEKCRKNNVPDANLTEDADKVFKNILMQARISIGTLFRLQDWAGVDRNPVVPLGSLVGIKFGGKVDEGNLADSKTTEVSSVFSHKKELPTQ